MSIEQAMRLQRTARIAYSTHPAAKFYRAWLYLVAHDGADPLLLPLTLLMLALFLFGSVPGASDLIAASCSIACMP
jgi:hypothetical protein